MNKKLEDAIERELDRLRAERKKYRENNNNSVSADFCLLIIEFVGSSFQHILNDLREVDKEKEPSKDASGV